ncbi:MAG: class I SAM-dependent methyltransferase [Aquiluna sp.]|nr:class I SAM-dependent methyltransferase [Aquiluna sp.]MCF8545683.1 class I SAM-dependent methyltransferase [Aquiluna sp.]
MMDPLQDPDANYLEINKANWDSRVDLHLQGYNLDKFRSDSTYLSDVVRFDLGRFPDLNGLRGIHFQSHIGTDTISLARLGATMFGLDLSPKSVAAANQLALEFGHEIRFIESDVYSAASLLSASHVDLDFDFVYTGVGALCWLPDIKEWSKAVKSVLRKGGFLFIREAHPVVWTLSEKREDGGISLEYDYFAGPGLLLSDEESYAGEGTVASPANVSFNHSLSQIFNSLWDEGFEIDLFEEHNSLPWRPWEKDFVLNETNGEYTLKDRPNRLPASYTLKATLKKD